MILTGIKKEGNNVKLDANLGDGVTLNVAISNISVSTDVDFGIFSGLKKANVTMTFDDSVKAEYQAEHISKQVPLGTIEMGIGPTPLPKFRWWQILVLMARYHYHILLKYH